MTGGRVAGVQNSARVARPRVLVTGGGGQLGRWLAARSAGIAEVHALGRADLDITNVESILAALSRVRPAVVINAAAYTNVDAAETDAAAAKVLNSEGPARLAAACAARGCALLQVSTDYVVGRYAAGLGGRGDVGRAADVPLAAVAPEAPGIGSGAEAAVYAHTKWRGEVAARARHPETLVVRTAWVYTGPGRGAVGLGGSDFVATMLRLGGERELLTVVADQWGSPTFAADLAQGLLSAALRLADGDHALEGAVLNATGAGQATWFDLARATFARAGLDPARIAPVGTEEFPRPAARPGYSVLSGVEWHAAGLPPLPPWQDGLRRAFLVGR